MKIFNPILTGFHADPSILCARGEYVIANSTFEWYPGVELHRSKDLKTWESIPSPLNEDRLLNMAGNKCSCGIWAPCLSYADNKYWLIYTNTRSWDDGPWKDTPNFLTTAENLEGPWSDPVFMNASGFDPSMFHDDDGKHWFINMEWDYRETGARQFSGILIQEYDDKKKELVGPVRKIFRGTDIGLVEGTHIFKHNGWYYICSAEGGTEYEHAITCARSKNLFGPYEVHPANPLISSYGHDELKIQRAGHGQLCLSPDGTKTYLAYLCGRPLDKMGFSAPQKRCVLGRETSLAEIVWRDDWPYVIQPDGELRNYPPEYIEVEGEGDVLPGAGVKHIAEKYTFENEEFLKEFKTLREPLTEKKYSLAARPGFLRLYGGMTPTGNFGQSILCRRQTDFCFEAETKLEFNPENFQQFAGMTYRYDERLQYLCVITNNENLGRVLQVFVILPGNFERRIETPIKDGPVWIRLCVNGAAATFSFSQDGKIFRNLRPILDASKLSDEYFTQGFTGAFVGMFCTDMIRYKNYADFEYFRYSRK